MTKNEILTSEDAADQSRRAVALQDYSELLRVDDLDDAQATRFRECREILDLQRGQVSEHVTVIADVMKLERELVPDATLAPLLAEVTAAYKAHNAKIEARYRFSAWTSEFKMADAEAAALYEKADELDRNHKRLVNIDKSAKARIADYKAKFPLAFGLELKPIVVDEPAAWPAPHRPQPVHPLLQSAETL
jgi:hypothetical protein